jgi:hypothetical protein
MPAHTSHLLQPFDVSCFSPLKRAYGYEIQELARQGLYHINKIDFLTIYTRIRLAVFTQQNIQAGFQATGLIPQYVARGGALQAQQGQQLAAEADMVVAEVEQAYATQGRQRAPPTCSKCHVQGHMQTQCRQ